MFGFSVMLVFLCMEVFMAKAYLLVGISGMEETWLGIFDRVEQAEGVVASIKAGGADVPKDCRDFDVFSIAEFTKGVLLSGRTVRTIR